MKRRGVEGYGMSGDQWRRGEWIGRDASGVDKR